MNNLLTLIEESEKNREKSLTASAQTKAKVLKKYGSTAQFLQSLTIKIINKPRQKEFKELYAFYEIFFTLPDETESYEGFEATLALNNDSALQKQYGRFEEAWLYAAEEGDNKIIAGINFSTYCPVGGRILHPQFGGTAHIIYIFVDPAYRSMGLARYLMKLAEAHAMQFSNQTLPLLFFCEQNAPELMTAEQYFTDNANALVDQCDRLIWWHKAGYRRLMFNYVQPPLNPGQLACYDLTLNVLTGKRSIPASILAFHLERFFSLAVFKANIELRDDIYKAQMNLLNQLKSVSTTGSEAYYRRLKRLLYQTFESWEPRKKLF